MGLRATSNNNLLLDNPPNNNLLIGKYSATKKLPKIIAIENMGVNTIFGLLFL